MQTLKPLFEKLQKSLEFKNFKEKNPDAFLCAGFFILNFKNNIFEYNFDSRDKEDIFTFKVPFDSTNNKIIMLKDKILDINKPLEEINTEIQIDISDLKDIVDKALINKGIKNKLEEIIAVLQMHDNMQVYNLTCMCEGFLIVSIYINPETGEVISFSKKNLFDFASVKKNE